MQYKWRLAKDSYDKIECITPDEKVRGIVQPLQYYDRTDDDITKTDHPKINGFLGSIRTSINTTATLNCKTREEAIEFIEKEAKKLYNQEQLNAMSYGKDF